MLIIMKIKMKKLFMVLCVVIMFFGIVGSTSSDDLTLKSTISSVVTKSQIGDYVASPVSTPATLLLLGFGLIGLAKFGRKKNMK
jgi:hypothetical protein